MKITRDHVKKVATTVVGFSVGAVVKRIIQNNATPESTLQSAELFVASYALGGMVAKAAREYTDQKVDEYADKLKQMKEQATLETEN